MPADNRSAYFVCRAKGGAICGVDFSPQDRRGAPRRIAGCRGDVEGTETLGQECRRDS